MTVSSAESWQLLYVIPIESLFLNKNRLIIILVCNLLFWNHVSRSINEDLYLYL